MLLMVFSDDCSNSCYPTVRNVVYKLFVYQEEADYRRGDTDDFGVSFIGSMNLWPHDAFNIFILSK